MAGFAAGVLIDLAPPADTLLGVNAIVYLAIGYVTGFVIDPRDRTVPILDRHRRTVGGRRGPRAPRPWTRCSAATGWPGRRCLGMVLSSALYAVILAPVVILGVAWLVALARRPRCSSPDPSREYFAT